MLHRPDALHLRGGGAVQLAAVHRLRDLWLELAPPGGSDTALTAGARLPLSSLQAHMQRRGGDAFAACDAARAIAHARRRHGETQGETPPGSATLSFTDLLRVAFPLASADELAAIELAAPPQATREQRIAVSRARARLADDTAAAALREQELDLLLMRADADGSGELDRLEFVALCAKLGVTNVDEANELFDRADDDCSGAVNLAEFRHWWLTHSS
jgi:hypothetical protein